MAKSLLKQIYSMGGAYGGILGIKAPTNSGSRGVWGDASPPTRF